MSAITLKAARETLATAKLNVSAALSEVHSHQEEIGRLRVRIGVEYYLVRTALTAQPNAFSGTWVEWANAQYPGGPDVYRLYNAGVVATVLGDAVGEAGERSLTPLYRILKAAEKKDEKAKTAAIEKVRKLWASLIAKRKATDPYPSEEKVLSAVDKATGSTGGTRGKAAGGGNAAKRSTRKNRAKATTPAKADPLESIGPDLSEKDLRTLDGSIRRMLSKVPHDSLGAFQTVLLDTCEKCRTYGPDAVSAAIRSGVKETRATNRKAA